MLAHSVRKLGLCCVHSSAPKFDRSLREGAPCATMSTLTCYRTSRSFHFPFWAVCSLSGTQPEFSFGRLQPHVEKDKPRCFWLPFNPRPSSSAPRRVTGPRAPLARSTRAIRPQQLTRPSTGHDSRTSGNGANFAYKWHPRLFRWPQNTFGPGSDPVCPVARCEPQKKRCYPHILYK